MCIRDRRWVLSLVSLVAYVITKIAVGIFAGGVVFAALLPDVRLALGSVVLNSFWIGSVLVVLLTGVYTVLGGMRAVAYTEAIQTLILVIGSLVLTIYGLNVLGGWGQLRAVLGPEMFNLWKPLVPAGLEGTWAPVKEAGRIAWYFNGDYPWLGMLFCARSSGSGTGAPTSTSCSARSGRRIRPKRGEGPSSPPSSSCCRSSSSSFPA